MPALSAGLDYVDLMFRGRPQLIATAVLHGPAGVALIDPGPTTTLASLDQALDSKGIRFRDVRQILLTHIHLDHAGVAGTITHVHRHIEVFVHERGAPHVQDPSKLIASAGRLYGQDMDRLWGPIEPVSPDRIRVLKGGELLTVAGREIEVAYTPGHASHHVSFFDLGSRVAFVGDTAGIKRRPRADGAVSRSAAPELASEGFRGGAGGYVLPPAPPPDVDLEAWRESARRILAWDPDMLFLTHFGPYHGARQQFDELFDHLAEWSRVVRRLLADQSLDDAERQRQFVDEAFTALRRQVGDEEAEDYVRAGGLTFSWLGLARYWRRRP